MTSMGVATEKRPDKKAPGATEQLGSSRGVPEFPARLLEHCKAYSSRVELFQSLDFDGDVACVFASDMKTVADIKAGFKSRKILLSGRVLRDKSLKAQTGDAASEIVLAEENFTAFSEAHGSGSLAVVIIDRAPKTKNYCSKILKWAQQSLTEGGFIIVQEYAFWRKGKEVNPMVTAANEFVAESKSAVVGFAFNGDGYPDLCLQVGPSKSGVEKKA